MHLRTIVGVVGLSLTSGWGCEQAQGGRSYVAKVTDARGLTPGAAVQVSGVRVGRVKTVSLEGEGVAIEFGLTPDAPRVHADACVAIASQGLAGEMHLRLTPGQGEPLDTGSEITCDESDRGNARVDEIFEAIASGKGVLGRLIHDEKLADKVEKFFESPPAGTTSGAPSPEPPTEPPPPPSASAAQTAPAPPPAPKSVAPRKPVAPPKPVVPPKPVAPPVTSF